MNILLIVLCALLWGTDAYSQEQGFDPACTNECNSFTPDCTVYIECRIAKSACITNCMQRKVWEKVALSLDKLTAVLEKQAEEKKEKQSSEEGKDGREADGKEKDDKKDTSIQY